MRKTPPSHHEITPHNPDAQLDKSRGPTKEHNQKVSEIHLFDIDGVLTNPGEKSTKLTELYDIIAQKLTLSIPVALNTGRSSEWAILNILPHIQARTDSEDLWNFLIVGEKGNTWSSYNGEDFVIFSSKGTLSDVALYDIEQIAEHYKDIIGILDPKKTMVSLEVLKHIEYSNSNKNSASLTNIEKFNTIAPEIIDKLQMILEKHNLGDSFRIDKTTIAIDIERVDAGKDLGAERMFSFLDERGIEYSDAIATTYGDSGSDLKMAQAASRRSLKTVFVFTGAEGSEPKLSATSPITLVISTGYDKGTLAYLKHPKE